MTEPLFRHADFEVLPARGAFTAAEVAQEWTDSLVFALEQYAEHLAAGTMSPGQIEESARLYYSDTARDVAKLLPFVGGDDEAMTHVHQLEEARDRMREIF